MRILVISDSHGDSYALRQAIEQQPTAKMLFFLGDGEYDTAFLDGSPSGMFVHKVKGNCDYGSSLPAYVVDEVGGIRIYACHGHMEQVKYTRQYLIDRARDNGASIALYGHTHVSDTTYCDGLWLVNPGSIRNDSYAVIDITEQGIMPILMKLR